MFTTINCKTLRNIHKLCESLTKQHQIYFVLIKYKLIHLIKNVKKLNIIVFIRINTIVRAFLLSIKILKMFINSKLK